MKDSSFAGEHVCLYQSYAFLGWLSSLQRRIKPLLSAHAIACVLWLVCLPFTTLANDTPPANIDEVFAGYEHQLKDLEKIINSQNTIIATNKTDIRRYGNTLHISQMPHIKWSVSFSIYTADFASQFDFPGDMVTDLPDGMGLLGYYQITNGETNLCGLTFAIKKEIGLETPKEDFIFPLLLKPITSVMSIKSNDSSFRYTSHPRTYIGTPDSSPGELNKTQNFGIVMYSGIRYEGYDFFSTFVGCTESNADFFSDKDLELSIFKKTGINYHNKNDYVHFPLPNKFANIAAHFLKLGQIKNLTKMYE